MCPLRRSAKPGMEWYLLAASAESMRAVPSSNSTIFSPLSQCSPWLPRKITRDWFHSPMGRRCFAPVGAVQGPPVRHAGPLAARDLLDRAIHDLPMRRGHGVVTQAAPSREGPAVEQQAPAGDALGVGQLIGPYVGRAERRWGPRLGAERGAAGREREEPPSLVDHVHSEGFTGCRASTPPRRSRKRAR